jgi:hypothetical protein
MSTPTRPMLSSNICVVRIEQAKSWTCSRSGKSGLKVRLGAGGGGFTTGFAKPLRYSSATQPTKPSATCRQVWPSAVTGGASVSQTANRP